MSPIEIAKQIYEEKRAEARISHGELHEPFEAAVRYHQHFGKVISNESCFVMTLPKLMLVKGQPQWVLLGRSAVGALADIVRHVNPRLEFIAFTRREGKALRIYPTERFMSLTFNTRRTA